MSCQEGGMMVLLFRNTYIQFSIKRLSKCNLKGLWLRLHQGWWNTPCARGHRWRRSKLVKEMGSKHAVHMKSPSRKKNKTKKTLLIRVTFADSGGHSMFTHSSTHMHYYSRQREAPQCSSISLSERNIWRASVKSPTQRRGIYLHLQIAHNMPRATGSYSAVYIWIL